MSRPVNFFAPGEWYHCYSRGIDKRRTFENAHDYRRFIELLYLTNATKSVCRSDLSKHSLTNLFSRPRTEQLVEIGAYAIMPNHFHILIHEQREGGISTFMQKLLTAYTMYFNIRNERSGGLFTKPFRARLVNEDRYLQHVVDYIHLNPLELFVTNWKEKNTEHAKQLIDQLKSYQYASFPDFQAIKRPERAILGDKIFKVYVQKEPTETIHNALKYGPTETVKATP